MAYQDNRQPRPGLDTVIGIGVKVGLQTYTTLQRYQELRRAYLARESCPRVPFEDAPETVIRGGNVTKYPGGYKTQPGETIIDAS